TVSLPDGEQNVAYDETISATGGISPYTWSETTTAFDANGNGAAGTPCEGLTIDLTVTTLTTTVSGTPVNDGDCDFTVQVADSSSPQQTDLRALKITIITGPPTITTTVLPDAVLDAFYAVGLAAVGGTNPLTWGLAPGSNPVPPDMALNNVGQLTGNPSAEEIFNFTVRLTDNDGRFDDQALSLTVLADPGRNDTIATATALSGCTPSCTNPASISPYADPVSTANPDNDFYELTATAGNVVTVEITARRLASPSVLDSIIEIVNSAGTRFITCRDEGTVSGVDGSPDSTPLLFDDVCLNDDIELGVIRDSKLEFKVPGAGTVTFFVRVLDFFGSARPDMLYELTITNAD
ncbi:MAG: hypothetical protein V3U28_04205, partial [Candidatus Acidoferrales bacterium]